MSTMNTIANLDSKNKGRFTGPFLTYVNSMVILSIYVVLVCNGKLRRGAGLA